MLDLGTLAFLNPWMLLALLSLPVIWWLLRVTPPAPSRVAFPPIRLLFDLRPKEETPAHTPLWLLLLRLLIAAIVILALAQPLLNPGTRLAGTGPVVIVVDDGWAAAAHWKKRTDLMGDLLDQAERDRRPVVLLSTAPPASGDPVRPSRLMAAAEARSLAAALRPKPWQTDREAALASILDLALPEGAETVWLSDGIGDERAVALAERLQWFGPVSILKQDGGEATPALLPPTTDTRGLKVRALRPEASGESAYWLRALGEQNRLLGRERIAFAAGQRQAELLLELPSEIRNRVNRLELENVASAGAVVLLDERFRRRPVGLASGGALETNQPLLSDLYYLDRALQPFAEVRQARIGELLARELAVIVLADVGQVVGEERAQLESWVNRGGMLVRFAGPKLAESSDDLVPVRLRAGGRALGGVLSWEQPARLSPFGEQSPFRGLAIPDDVLINQQVLAEPSLELPERTWARLADGTPLVTADRRGEGWIVLFHSTANTQWSNLSLSGLFVEMLRRLVEMSQGVAAGEGAGSGILPPLSLLDGFGRQVQPSGAAQPIAATEIARAKAGPRHPPGFYGSEDLRHTLNLTQGWSELPPLPAFPSGIELREWSGGDEVDLLAWLLALAIALGILDLVISMILRGHFTLARRVSAALLLGLLLATAASPERALAQDNSRDAYALAASLEFRLAYILTGNAEIDAMSRAGLIGLSRALASRTSVEPGDPLGVDIERDDILFFPLVYWPVTPEQQLLSPAAMAKLDGFMKTGGTILFDTRDQDLGGSFGGGRVTPSMQRLRQLLARLDLPPLIPVPEDHILTKAFYLMRDFPGRWSGGQVWVERHAGGSNDGVSSLVIGGNDWAAAWAVNEQGRPIAATVPGGQQQREFAYRFGINLVMYTLTGNYKADQVHIPALLERLGQ